MTCSFFTQAPFTLALHQWVQCASSEEHLSASDDEEDPNNWDVFLNLMTSFDSGARIQSSLADEEMGRVGLSCLCAMDCLCAELYAL